MRPTNLIVIHCSASANADRLFRGQPGRPGFQNPADVIDQWHAERGFHRSDAFRARQNPDLAAIGYHYVVGRDGTVFTGRHVDEIGAHVKGYNQKSLGICLVGLDQFTAEQYAALAHLIAAEVARLIKRNGPADRNAPLGIAAAIRLAGENGIVILGHCDLPNVHKTCPGFDVAAWLAEEARHGSR